ncbi:TATA box-binding protein-associated factor RNA polymerase I subunit A [Ambystoma mexicanum]|uniref:TATA box-binding protein-associated factor RNA polymerase I subunit A n=1 Tax=Ambystoma mexicanum TaxID=8296 RepID=UPI0037E997FF
MEELLVESLEEATQPLSSGIRLPNIQRHPNKQLVCGRGFRETADFCLHQIHNALFQNQWEQAAELLKSYFQTLEDTSTAKLRAAPEVIWRLGTEVLLHHPKSTLEDVKSFADRMKNLGVKNYLKVSLEHVFHLLCLGMTEDAYRHLTVAESWRYGDRSASEEKLIKLIQAHRALLDYKKWAEKRQFMLDNEVDYMSESAYALEMSSHFRQATGAFKEIIQYPGVWDTFVQSYADLLEFYGDPEGVQRLLNDYAYDSKYPANPNAHVFLYAFLKRSGEPTESLIKVLMILHQLVPSHELMLELNMLLQESGKEEHRQQGLQVLFSLLDFSSWKEHVGAWNSLAKQMKAALHGKHSEWLQAEWSSREDWWPAFHFSHYLAKKDWQQSERLAMKKALVAGILLGKGSKYFTFVVLRGSTSQRKKCKRMKQFVKKHSMAGSG